MIDTIFVIGNGFDIWQGLNTRYCEFQKYYLEHRDSILKRLHIKPVEIVDEDGKFFKISDVEIVYGDPFDPDELEEEFWGSFEMSLGEIDSEQLNLFFGKDRKGLRAMEKSIRNAKRILQEAFCSWISSISVEKKDSGYSFGDNCLFINFNYTDTLTRVFGVDDSRVFHIHGEATGKKSIVFGHSSHPQEPEDVLFGFGGRFRGLYFVDRLLYETDKHVEDNIQMLCLFLASHGVMPEEIRHVYVLGHSMSPPDISYFVFLARATSVNQKAESAGENEAAGNPEEMEDLFNRLHYTIDHVGYQIEDEKIPVEYRNSVFSRQLEKLQNRFFGRIPRRKMKAPELSVETDSIKRTEDAGWNISCFNEEAVRWAERLMNELGCSNYMLFPSIDDCISKFRKS